MEINININIEYSDSKENPSNIKLEEQIRNTIKQELRRQKLPGGLLYKMSDSKKP